MIAGNTIDKKIQKEVRDFLAGVEGADRRLFDLLNPRLLRVTGKWLDSQERQDAVQDVCLALFENLRKREAFDGDYLAYARRAARNRCIEILKKKAARREFSVENIEEMTGGGFTDGIAAIAILETRSRMGRALAALSPECRWLIVRHYYERMPMRELLPDVKANTVQALYHRRKNCLKRLQKILKILG